MQPQLHLLVFKVKPISFEYCNTTTTTKLKREVLKPGRWWDIANFFLLSVVCGRGEWEKKTASSHVHKYCVAHKRSPPAAVRFTALSYPTLSAQLRTMTIFLLLRMASNMHTSVCFACGFFFFFFFASLLSLVRLCRASPLDPMQLHMQKVTRVDDDNCIAGEEKNSHKHTRAIASWMQKDAFGHFSLLY